MVDPAVMLLLGAAGLIFASRRPAPPSSSSSPAAPAAPKPSAPKPPAGVTPAPEPKAPPARPIVVVDTPTGLPPPGAPQVSPYVPPSKPSAPKPPVPAAPAPPKPKKKKKQAAPAPPPAAPKPKKKKKPKPTIAPSLKPDAAAKPSWEGAPAPITDKTPAKVAAEYLAQYARLGGDLGIRGKPAAYVQAAQRAMGMPVKQVDGIYGSVTQARGEKLGVKMPTRVRTPKEAAAALARHLAEGNPRGTRAKPSAYVKAAQRDMQMPAREQDGIYGPKTKSAAEALGAKPPK